MIEKVPQCGYIKERVGKMETLLNYLKQRSTWLGIIAIVTGLGASIKPELQEAIATMGMSLAGLIMVIYNENHKSNKK